MPGAEDAPDPVALAVEVGRQLDALGIRYLVGGSLASSVHGEPRSTLDIDIVADLRASDVAGLGATFGRDFYLDLDAVPEAIATGSSFNAIHLPSAIKVDFFVAGTDPFEEELLRERVRLALGPDPSATLWMDGAEYTVLRKLEWFRRGGEVSDRQWRDVTAIVAVQGDRLDRERLTRWADRLGVEDLLRRLLR